MDFQTLVDTDAVGIKIEHDEAVMMLGSCFAEDVGNLLKRSMLALCINPFGTLYNPRSIAQSLRRLMADEPFSADELVAYGNLWHSMSHHSRFSSVDKDRALQKINAAYAEGVACLRSARHLIVTFGTAYTFSTADGETVANCHKMPASMFNRRMLSTNEIADEWIPLIDDIRKFNPHIDITFTVSPVRHLADGAHGNQLSKSTLLLAVDSIMAQRPGVCHYFPSYEIMLDQLRDYRFFAADMVHPSDVAVAYVAERFKASCLSDRARQACTRCEKVYARLLHRPLTDDSKAAEAFRAATRRAADTLSADMPYVKTIIDKLLKQ